MAERPAVTVKRLTREKLASFLRSHELIKAFESLQSDVGDTLPDATFTAQESAEAALEMARIALALAGQSMLYAQEAGGDDGGGSGPPGARGDPGPIGPQGPGGGIAIFVADDPEEPQPGPPGARGESGASGAAGPQGPAGPAVFLVGEAQDGEAGAPGPRGNDGDAGAAGSQGPIGPAVFVLGEAGEEGEHGPPGRDGAQGQQGSTGPAGAAGAVIYAEPETPDEPMLVPGPTGPQGPSGGGGTTGTATLDFGSTAAGRSSIVVTGQAGITAGSSPRAWFSRDSTADNDAEAHEMAGHLVSLACGDVIAGTGFTIYAASQAMASGQFGVRWGY